MSNEEKYCKAEGSSVLPLNRSSLIHLQQPFVHFKPK